MDTRWTRHWHYGLTGLAILGALGAAVWISRAPAPRQDPPAPSAARGTTDSPSAEAIEGRPATIGARTAVVVPGDEATPEALATATPSLPPQRSGRVLPPPPESAQIHAILPADIPPEVRRRLKERRKEEMKEGIPQGARAAGHAFDPVSVERTGIVRPMGEDRLLPAAQPWDVPPEAQERLRKAGEEGGGGPR